MNFEDCNAITNFIFLNSDDADADDDDVGNIVEIRKKPSQAFVIYTILGVKHLFIDHLSLLLNLLGHHHLHDHHHPHLHNHHRCTTTISTCTTIITPTSFVPSIASFYPIPPLSCQPHHLIHHLVNNHHPTTSPHLKSANDEILLKQGNSEHPSIFGYRQTNQMEAGTGCALIVRLFNPAQKMLRSDWSVI